MARAKPTSDLESHLGYWLRLVSNHVSHAFSEKLAQHDITVAEWVVLRLLQDGELNPSQIAKSMGMTRGAISKVVDRLTAKRLIRVSANEEDRRFQTLSLTTAGAALVPRLAALADQNETEFFGYLTDAQRDELMRLMRDIARERGLVQVPVE